VRRLKHSEVEEIRIVDRCLGGNTFQSACYIRARGVWFRDVRFPAEIGDYDRESIIKEFIAFQSLYERLDGPPE
jgi:hypothetical protein